jgi:hypothetical protein
MTLRKNSKSPIIMKLIALILTVFVGSLLTRAGDVPLWERGWFTAPAKGYTSENRFSVRAVRQDGLHLTGICTYFQLEKQTPVIAVIEGTDAQEEGFWPDVTTEVRIEQTGKWQTLSEPFNHGHRKVIGIKPGEYQQELFVTLDVLFPFVGKQKLGRLVLRSGETAMIDLDKLLERSPGEE